MSPLTVAAAVATAVVAAWCGEAWRHRRRLDRVTWRVHVNGTRGKSTVTRLVAGALRESGIPTVAKSTGTAAAVIDRDGVDVPIRRRGPATILEQVRVIRRHVGRGVEALVVECMALHPAYQEVSERRMVRSNIGVLTNVRHDHQDVMGETLPEIAESLLRTCPTGGVLVTAERDPTVLPVIERVARQRHTRLVVADPADVSDEEIDRFGYVSFKENVAVALCVADLVGVDRDTALRGMVAAEPDPGVLRVTNLELDGTLVTWANLFAVNDRESMIAAMDRLAGLRSPETVAVGVLNNRADRPHRALQFADIAAGDLDFDHLVTLGSHERLVTARLVARGVDAASILNLGDDLRPTTGELLGQVLTATDARHVLLVGFVNVHTAQAEALVDFIEGRAAGPSWPAPVPTGCPS